MAESTSDPAPTAPQDDDAPEPFLELRSKRYDDEFVLDLDRVQEQLQAESSIDNAKDDPTAPVVLTWKNLSVFAGKKQLLHNLKGKITVGFYAIMGPSGSGKTTLLNSLACRLDRLVKVKHACLPHSLW
jgi:ABC-type transport system involved in cytochrome bd biosynthesis fused ATPase/permease subunit